MPIIPVICTVFGFRSKICATPLIVSGHVAENLRFDPYDEIYYTYKNKVYVVLYDSG